MAEVVGLAGFGRSAISPGDANKDQPRTLIDELLVDGAVAAEGAEVDASARSRGP